MKPARIVSAALMISFLSQGASAGVRDAAFASSGDRAQADRGLFVGASLRIGRSWKDEKHRAIPSLELAGMARNGATRQIDIAQGIALSASRAGSPRLTMGGRPVSGDGALRSRLSTVAGVALGLGVAAAIGALVVLDNIRDENRED